MLKEIRPNCSLRSPLSLFLHPRLLQRAVALKDRGIDDPEARRLPLFLCTVPQGLVRNPNLPPPPAGVLLPNGLTFIGI